jgi:hypothetical protein
MSFAIKDEDLIARAEAQDIVSVTGFIRAKCHGLAVRGKRDLWCVESAECHMERVALLPLPLGEGTLDHQRDPFTVLHNFVYGRG